MLLHCCGSPLFWMHFIWISWFYPHEFVQEKRPLHDGDAQVEDQHDYRYWVRHAGLRTLVCVCSCDVPFCSNPLQAFENIVIIISKSNPRVYLTSLQHRSHNALHLQFQQTHLIWHDSSHNRINLLKICLKYIFLLKSVWGTSVNRYRWTLYVIMTDARKKDFTEQQEKHFKIWVSTNHSRFFRQKDWSLQSKKSVQKFKGI